MQGGFLRPYDLCSCALLCMKFLVNAFAINIKYNTSSLKLKLKYYSVHSILLVRINCKLVQLLFDKKWMFSTHFKCLQRYNAIFF